VAPNDLHIISFCTWDVYQDRDCVKKLGRIKSLPSIPLDMTVDHAMMSKLVHCRLNRRNRYFHTGKLGQRSLSNGLLVVSFIVPTPYVSLYWSR